MLLTVVSVPWLANISRLKPAALTCHANVTAVCALATTHCVAAAISPFLQGWRGFAGLLGELAPATAFLIFVGVVFSGLMQLQLQPLQLQLSRVEAKLDQLALNDNQQATDIRQLLVAVARLEVKGKN